jgi:hypothetical protein
LRQVNPAVPPPLRVLEQAKFGLAFLIEIKARDGRCAQLCLPSCRGKIGEAR